MDRIRGRRGRHLAVPGPGHDVGQPVDGGRDPVTASGDAARPRRPRGAQLLRPGPSNWAQDNLEDHERHHPPARRRTLRARSRFGALIGDQQFKTKVKQQGPGRQDGQAAAGVVGKSVPRIRDHPDKLSGHSFSYIQDVKIPGMVHGRVGAASRGINATLGSRSTAGRARRPAGLIKVVVIKKLRGRRLQAWGPATQAAAENIKLTWKDPGGMPGARGSSGPACSPRWGPAARLLVADGNVDAALAGAAKKLEATYLYPYQLHAAMGPSCAIADVGTKRRHGLVRQTQGPYPLRSALGRPPEVQGDQHPRDLQGGRRAATG